MFAVAVLLLGAVSPIPGRPQAEQVELVEINHCYNRDTGERRFVQVIYWDRQNTACLHVRHWHMADKLHGIHPRESAGATTYTVIRQTDGPAKVQILRARRYRVTHTFHDPEEIDRRSFPQEARQPLGR